MTSTVPIKEKKNKTVRYIFGILSLVSGVTSGIYILNSTKKSDDDKVKDEPVPQGNAANLPESYRINFDIYVADRIQFPQYPDIFNYKNARAVAEKITELIIEELYVKVGKPIPSKEQQETFIKNIILYIPDYYDYVNKRNQGQVNRIPNNGESKKLKYYEYADLYNKQIDFTEYMKNI